MDLNQYARVLRAHWLLIALSICSCALAAGWLTWTRTPVYSAQTQLFVSIGGGPASEGQTYQGGVFVQQRVGSYARVASSAAVMQRVITQLGLRETVPELQARVRASVPSDTVLIDVIAKDQSPSRAKAIADAVGKHFATFVNTLETPPGQRQSPVKVTVTNPAELPTHPVSPRKLVSLVLGVVLGLVLGVGGAVLREALNRRIRGEDDAAAVVRAPVLGKILEDSHADGRPLVVAYDPSSAAAEAYRRLRTNLRVLSIDHGVQSFVVSSAVESEGKSLISANLGVAFAQAGARVVLVDADLRRPTLADLLGLPSTLGLSGVLEDDVPVEAALQTWRDGLPLEVLASGWQPSNPSELLESPRLAAVLRTLTDRADVVILDAPALLPVADAAILTRLTSGIMLVTRVGSTRSEQLETAVQSLDAVDGQVLGVVLNRLPARSAWRYPGSGHAPESDRLAAVARQFARQLRTIDPTCEVPPTRLLPPRRRRAIPYLYTPAEIAALMHAAGQLRGRLHAATHQTLLGLMAVTGIRLGGAIRLDRDDIDERHQLLRIVDSKFGKSREVVLHDSAMAALHAYRERREQLCPPSCEAFFVSIAGTRLFSSCVHRVFARLVRIVGLEPRSPRCRPRMHDLRHSFAVRTLLDWHATGADIQARLPSLSTYIGHVGPASTYYYLHAAPELLALAARRLEPAPGKTA